MATLVLSELSASVHKRDAKFAARAEKVLIRVDRQVQEFRSRQRLNFYKRSKAANTFLWALKDGGCPPEYASELTEWLALRL
jgi:hypothetical protein